MSANVEAMVREGVNAFKSGRKDEAHALLLKATELDPYNEQAWLWLSGLMEGVADQRTCLENVLAINPNNERAKQGLAYLTGQTSYGNVSPFSAATPPPSAPPSTAPPGIAPSAPTSVEWGMPDSTPTSPPAWTPPPPAEPSSDVLDDWVSNLNLPSTETHQTPGDFTADATSSPFGGAPFGDFDVDEDLFAGGPFSASAIEPDAPAPAPNRSRTGSSRRSSPPPPPRRAPREPEPTYNDESDEAYFEDAESEDGLFGYIPPEITPTRLPGTRERTPILLTLALIVLILLNIGVSSLVMFAILA